MEQIAKSAIQILRPCLSVFIVPLHLFSNDPPSVLWYRSQGKLSRGCR